MSSEVNEARNGLGSLLAALAGTTGRRVVMAVVALAGLLAPLILTDSQMTIYVLLGTAAIVTVGVSLLMGYAGQVSLGQGAFYGIGAYTAAMLSMHGIPTVLALVCAPFVAALFATLVGIPILRLRGHYLAFATLAFQLIVLSVVGQMDSLGGDVGLRGIPPLNIAGLELLSGRAYGYVTFVALAIVLFVTHNIIASRPGRGLRALATSETAAESSGVPVARYRLVVFGLSAAFAGLAGGIYAYFIGYIAPGSFPVLLSIEFVVMAVIGGLGSIWGPVLGAGVVTILVQAMNTLGTQPGMPVYASNVFSYAVYAGMLVLVLLFLPRGLLPSTADWLRSRRRAKPEDPTSKSTNSSGRA